MGNAYRRRALKILWKSAWTKRKGAPSRDTIYVVISLKEAVNWVLKKVNLYEARKKLAGRYSGGMKRRLSVAIAIINNPKVIYLDEPSTVRYELHKIDVLSGIGSKE